jgi:hypothetical protein
LSSGVNSIVLQALHERGTPHTFQVMNHRPIHRAFAGFSAVWFAMLMVAGPVLHECALHDGGTASASAESPAGAHAGHGGATESSPDDGGCDHCTCIGDCAGSAFVALVSGAMFAGAEVPTPIAAIGVHALVPAPGSPDVQLPYAVGPPLLA